MPAGPSGPSPRLGASGRRSRLVRHPASSRSSRASTFRSIVRDSSRRQTRGISARDRRVRCGPPSDLSRSCVAPRRNPADSGSQRRRPRPSLPALAPSTLRLRVAISLDKSSPAPSAAILSSLHCAVTARDGYRPRPAQTAAIRILVRISGSSPADRAAAGSRFRHLASSSGRRSLSPSGPVSRL